MSQIPTFPDFKNIELTDRPLVERLTEKFPPYSDFHFSSLYSWDIHHKMRLSLLNGNLVVLFEDYMTGKFFMTFIGSQEIMATAHVLLEFSAEHRYESCLRLISEEMSHALHAAGFMVEPDLDAHDYIYSINHLALMHTWRQGRQRRQIKKFIVANP